jgi:hypothetical protein
MIDAMIDLETLSTRPNAVILSVGAVKFNPHSDYIDMDEGLDLRLDVDQQISMGRDLQEETIQWWEKQNKDVQEMVFDINDRISINNFIKKLNKFLVGVDSIWAQGPAFDIVILENLYRQLESPTPWQFWQIRDSRTLFAVHGDPREKNRVGVHNALKDCYYQAIGVQQIYKKLNIQPKFK